MRNIFRGVLAAAALAALTIAPSAHAAVVPITLNGGWNTFLFGDAGSDFQDVNGDTIDFTFTLATTAKLHLADGFFDGDQFDVVINGIDKGATSTPTFTGAFVGQDWSKGFFSPTFTNATYILGPGTYDVTGTALLSPFSSGQAAVALGAVPEPSVWAMMIMGLASIGAVLRRRRTVGVAAA